MTETFRHSGEYPQQQSSAPVPPGGTQGAYPPPPYYAPEAPQGPPPPQGHAPARRRRAKGPVALLAAVAIAAAAVGGGTAYAVQSLTDRGGGSSATSTDVVPTSRKGTVSGVAEAVSPSIVEVSAATAEGKSTGSGVITKSDGEIVTNNHVIAGATSIKVRTNDGKTYDAEVVGTDSKKDLALIQLKGASGLKPATLGNSDNVKVGDEVVAIGSPEGLTGTVTSGIVSALDRDVTVPTGEGQEQPQNPQDGWPFEFDGRQFNGDTGASKTTYKALQTDASLNPGNSGGALIDMNGNIIGINSAMYSPSSSQGGSESASSGSIGLGFAIPIDTVKDDLGKLRSGSKT
ncbi:S1C family serine protease [Streptomyces venezuelae]|uniref:Serine protease n=1 Tax=Streptomyces venezuelae TaxID=54571 RepID=A0A5P2BYJ4_STRVZ|nr:trypsin-like peptidase domain-containing protein [Streptomyces venezuelae]QES35582.1 serine protease [Streptomyces venezuelae]